MRDEDTVLFAAKTATFITINIAISEKRKKGLGGLHQYLQDNKRYAIFMVGCAIEALYLRKKIFNLSEDPELNKHLQNAIFSLIFQVFGDCLIFDNYTTVAIDAANVLATYGITSLLT